MNYINQLTKTMKLKYINQLTDNELGELYSAFIKKYCGFKVEQLDAFKGDTIVLEGSYYALDADNVETLFDDGFEINDYGVLSNDIGFGYNVELTKIMRKFMLNKFGKQYMEDCFWNDFGGED